MSDEPRKTFERQNMDESFADRCWNSGMKWGKRLRYVIAILIIAYLWQYERHGVWEWVKTIIQNVSEATTDLKVKK